MSENKKIKSPNIIFIMMDALRPDKLSCYGYKRNTSPNIDSLAKQGVLFENTFSSDNSTNKSTLNILSGRLLLTDKKGLSYDEKELKSFFDSGGILLQEILKEKGYKTYCLDQIFGWRRRGFDYYFKDEKKIAFIKKVPIAYNIAKSLFKKFGPKDKINKIKFGLDSERKTNEAIEIIKKEKENNFFIKIIYADTHMPYNSPQSLTKFSTETKSKKFFDIFSKEKGYSEQYVNFCKDHFDKDCEIEEIKTKYDNAIVYDDYLIGKIIKTLKEENLFENTILVLFSDHGESLDEHKIYADHHGLYDVSMRVPMIIFNRRLPKDKRIKALTSLQDITPTILKLVNIDLDSSLFDGKSLLPLIFGKKEKLRDLIFMEEQTYCNKKAIRTEYYKYIESKSKEEALCSRCNNFHQGFIELYDLEKDPEEKENIAKKNPELLIEMKLKLDREIKKINNLNEKRRIKKVLSKSL